MNSHNAQTLALDEAWGSEPPEEILALICEMACPRHEWLSAPGFSDDAIIRSNMASGLILTNDKRTRRLETKAKNFAMGAFAFTQGHCYTIDMVAQTRH